MSEQDPHKTVISEYLSHHRYQPPERDGWHSLHEISSGIHDELGVRVRAWHLLRVLDAFMQSEPPIVEDSWMRTDVAHIPVTDERFQFPDQPPDARRFYRVIDASIEYIKPEAAE